MEYPQEENNGVKKLKIEKEKLVDLQREIYMMRSQSLDSYRMYGWTDKTDYAITSVLKLLDKHAKRLEILELPSQREESRLIPSEIEDQEKNCGGDIREVTYKLEGMSMFVGVRWFITKS